MTQGEQMVWAVVYARAYRLNTEHPAREVLLPGRGDKWEAWEGDQAVSAAEAAWAVVSRMRDIGPRLEEGYGSKDEVVQMWLEMTGRENSK